MTCNDADFTDRLRVGHVAAGDEAVVGRTVVHVEGRLDAHDKLAGAARAQADGARLAVRPVVHLAPVVTALKE